MEFEYVGVRLVWWLEPVQDEGQNVRARMAAVVTLRVEDAPKSFRAVLPQGEWSGKRHNFERNRESIVASFEKNAVEALKRYGLPDEDVPVEAVDEAPAA